MITAANIVGLSGLTGRLGFGLYLDDHSVCDTGTGYYVVAFRCEARLWFVLGRSQRLLCPGESRHLRLLVTD